MTQLSYFSNEDVELIISLPYRVGMSVSYADDEEGERDDTLEMRALAACLAEIVKMDDVSSFSKEIIGEILRLRDKWPAWSEGVFNLAPLCERAVLVLKTQASDDEVKDYIKIILEIASAVAQAYGEFGEDVEPEKGFFGKAMGKIVGGFASMSADDAGHPMNVSAVEDSVISSIADALKKNM